MLEYSTTFNVPSDKTSTKPTISLELKGYSLEPNPLYNPSVKILSASVPSSMYCVLLKGTQGSVVRIRPWLFKKPDLPIPDCAPKAKKPPAIRPPKELEWLPCSSLVALSSCMIDLSTARVSINVTPDTRANAFRLLNIPSCLTC